MEKEPCFEGKKDKTKEKSISRRDFIKKTLSGLGILLVGPSARKIEATLGQSREGLLKEQSPEKVINKLNYIVEKISTYAVKQLGCDWVDIWNLNERPEVKKKIIKKLNQKPEIKKEIKEPAIMESLKEVKLNPEVVREFLKTLPKSWCKEVALITYVDKPTKVVANEITGEKDELVAHHQSKGRVEPSAIHFFPGAEEKEPETDLLPLLIYECAHANNWRYRADLSLGQRIGLLYEVIKRVESPDRFKYKMVEKISCKEKEKELAKKAIEYWAAISMHFIMLKEQPDAPLPIADMKLVFDYLKMTDPDFDILEMAKKRTGLLERARAERRAREK